LSMRGAFKVILLPHLWGRIQEGVQALSNPSP
jgi:hypothetical protein